jgi:ABC-type spermidine/putrescine transport system permease subunit I
MSENRFAAAFLAPGGRWLVALFVAPLVFLLAISFGTTDDLGQAIYA